MGRMEGIMFPALTKISTESFLNGESGLKEEKA